MRFLTAMTSACALLLMFAGCGSDDTSESAPATTEERAPSVGTDVANELNSSMDRAKDVENQVMQHKDRIDSALQEAEDDT